jgi:hypothetical protein
MSSFREYGSLCSLLKHLFILETLKLILLCGFI